MKTLAAAGTRPEVYFEGRKRYREYGKCPYDQQEGFEPVDERASIRQPNRRDHPDNEGYH
jgi:hypothetical protein